MTAKTRFLGSSLILGLVFFGASMARAQEDWKGKPDQTEFSTSLLTGVGLVDSKAGLSVIGAISRKLVEPGFAPDINNGVSIELEAGPVFLSGGASIFYSTHLRWDFRKTDDWGLYALGGLGGFTENSKVGNPFEFFPRFGIGTLWRLEDHFSLRAELSHELTAVGIHFAF